MNQNIERFIDIAGLAIVIGLIARWGPEFGSAVTAGGTAVATVLRQLTLADIQAPARNG